MDYVKKQDIEGIWSNLVFFPKQTENNLLDLTIKSVSTLEGIGSLDFGGSEYRRTNTNLVKPVQEEDPKYRWWTLKKGNYSIVFNELLSSDTHFAIIAPHERLLQAGGFHPTFIHINQDKPHEISTILTVCVRTLRIKENARLSWSLTVLILEEN